MSETELRVHAVRVKAGVSIARVIGEALRLKREGNLLVGLCPFHGEKTPSFTVYIDHFHCFGCGAHGDVFDWLMQAHRMTFAEAVAFLGGATHCQPLAAVACTPPPINSADSGGHVELARQIWCDAQNPRGTLVDVYLRHRGVQLPDAPVIRFHPWCPRKGGPLPAMVALMADALTGQPCGVHRTFLQPDGAGKALVDKAKMMLGNAGIIRLVDKEEIARGLGLAEIAELYALGDCFAVGGEGHPRVTDAQWDAINALIDQTARTAGP
jgi:DNA primase